MEIFVPGRLCLFGEHSDWAAQYRRANSTIYPGYAIVAGTNQGIYARVQLHDRLRFATVNYAQILELAMEETLLQNVAKTESFYSYVAGVAYEALKRYGVGGIAIDNYEMNLPLKKGLSSSAAICVLVARAFSQLYNLGLTIEEEMDLAYWGERVTLSQCGRLDQACAYGNQPILMVFDGDRTKIEPLTIGGDLHFIIVDLAGNKNTQTILASLNQCYPLANNPIHALVQSYLGEINAQIVERAISALQGGNRAIIGDLMNQAQAQFDRCLIPACPSQLTAPILHQLLAHPPLQEHIYGGKGVGSQGDGTAQLIAKDPFHQTKAISIIEGDFPQMQCYELNISKTALL
ncbi:GHMP kinase [Waterburya agarophytonicola K14]|uniref:GHMP kinase n=1 Tax=Waterburya agarophytonicola KI4 TaxID=2874699 RepID=A0A964FGF6_9CYAN|nr:GHMP kinase [Waterburya agarophytonicola]MCC0177956.1 GHMP kinase [Waterburya agarophytonicola KI4]